MRSRYGEKSDTLVLRDLWKARFCFSVAWYEAAIQFLAVLPDCLIRNAEAVPSGLNILGRWVIGVELHNHLLVARIVKWFEDLRAFLVPPMTGGACRAV